MNEYKVVIVSKYMPPYYSGVGIVAFNHAMYLLKTNSLSQVLTFSHKKPIQSNLLDVGVLPEEYMRRISHSFFNKVKEKKYIKIARFIKFNLSLFYKTFFSLFKNRKNYDILHCYGLSLLSFYSILVSKLLRKKIIVELTLFGCDDPLSLSKKSFFSFSGNVSKSQLVLADKVNHISGILMKSSIEARIPSKKLLSITYPVNTSKAYRLSKSCKIELKKKIFRHNKSVILFCGALVKRKGIDVAWDAFKILRILKPNNNYFFAITGTDKDNKEIEKISREAEELVISDKIKYFGCVNNIEEFMQASDYLIFPSRREGSPSTLKQAIACGLVTISSYLKEVTDEIIQNNVSGILIDNYDGFSYANKILEIDSNPMLYSYISDNACKQGKEKFSSDMIEKQYENAYFDLLK